MIKNKKVLKSIALFFVANLLFNVLLPLLDIGISKTYASTNKVQQQGVTAPNIVDLKTGDMNYSVPFISLPGGYDFNLSYNAGIQQTEKSSWVGLGWDLKVGEISRVVNGYPDDYAGPEWENLYGGVPEIKLHNDCNYGGSTITFSCGEYKLVNLIEAGVFDNSISSLTIPNGYSVTVFSEDNFSGSSVVFAASDDCLNNNGIDNALSSIKITRVSATRQYKPYGILNGYKMTQGKTVGSSLNDNISFDTYVSHFSDLIGTFTSYQYGGDGGATRPFTVFDNKCRHPYFPDGDTYFGGTFPNYDAYTVSGGTVAGNIQPVILQNPTLYHSNRSESLNNRASYIRKLFTNAKPNFRFINDFAQSFTTSNVSSFTGSTYNDISIDLGTNNLGYTPNYNGTSYGAPDFLSGSKHVDYFTNGEISDLTSTGAKSKGFIGYEGMPNTTARNSVTFFGVGTFNVQDQIGGYSITDVNGMTYHYALPVYEYGRTNYTKGFNGKITTTILNQPYAFKWLLTTITAPDFIDRNNNGYADEADWGNWTNFVYGKHLDNEIKDPHSGMHISQNNSEVKYTSMFETYYLDAAFNRANVVLFAKESRSDAYQHKGFLLRLSSATLFTSDGVRAIRSAKGFTSTTLYGDINSIRNITPDSYLSGSEISNLSTTVTNYISLVIGESRLNQDYSLCREVPYSSGPGIGRLTLNSVSYFGKNGSQLQPDYSFEYELSTPKTSELYVTHVPGDPGFGSRMGRVDFGNTSHNFVEGDIIKFTISSTTYYATLVKAIPATSKFDVVYLSWTIPGSAQVWVPAVTATETKNPPYMDGYYDTWGYFKSDKDYTPNLQNKNHKTTNISAITVDAWCLRKISTPTGAIIELEYESDTYSDVASMEGKRVLNVHPNIGFKPGTNSASYSALTNDGTYFFGMKFLKSHLTSNEYKLRFLDYDASSAIENNISAGSTVRMVSIPVYEFGATMFLSYAADITVLSKGIDAQGSYITVLIPTTAFEFLNGDDECVHRGSYLIIDNKKMIRYGGGVRVKSVSLKELYNGDVFKTTYDYSKRATQITSGSVTHDPCEYDMIDNTFEQVKATYPYTLPSSMNMIKNVIVNQYKNELAKLLNPFESVRYFVPPPAVNYEYVTIKNYANSIPENTSQEYQYSIFKKSMIVRDVINSSTPNEAVGGTDGSGIPLDKKSFACIVNTAYKDLTSKAGLLLCVKTFDAQDKVIAKQKYNYSNESSLPNNQGIIGQVFNEDRYGSREEIRPHPAFGYLIHHINEYRYCITNSFHRYPTILLSTETTNLLKGLSDKVTFHKYDFYSGSPIEIITHDSYGNSFKKKLVPLHDTPHSGGCNFLKRDGGHNRLVQISEEYIYKVDPANFDTHIGLIDAKVNQWGRVASNIKLRRYDSNVDEHVYEDDINTVQDETCISLPYRTYVWNSPKMNADGTYAEFAPFSASNPNANWKKIQETKTIDQYSNIISQSNINGNLVVNNYNKAEGGNYNAAFRTTSQTNSNTFTHLDFETNGIKVSGVIPHSGERVYSVSLPLALDMPALTPGKYYKTSIWVHESSTPSASLIVNVSGSGKQESFFQKLNSGTAEKCGSWYKLSIDFKMPDWATSANMTSGTYPYESGQTYLDDFRLQEVEEEGSAYVYDKLTNQLTHILDKDNFCTRCQYDDQGRVKALYKETPNGEVKVKEYKYNLVK